MKIQTAIRQPAPGDPRENLRPRDGYSPASRLLSVKQAAQYMGVSYGTMMNMVTYGKVPKVRLPAPAGDNGDAIRKILIDRRDLDNLIESCKEI